MSEEGKKKNRKINSFSREELVKEIQKSKATGQGMSKRHYDLIKQAKALKLVEGKHF